jgi:hypothetical protein
MNAKRVFLLTPTFLFVALSCQSCDFSSFFLKAGSKSNVSFSSSESNTRQSATEQPSDNSLKPCGSSLAPGESCALAVQFTPTVSGNHSGTLQIRSNGEVIEEIALSGQGE